MSTPLTAPLVDGFGRVHTDLRVSLTDRCNLRCTYCMPVEGLAWLPRDEILTDDEVVRLADLDPRLDLSLTTNGVGLARTATALRAAGLRRVNVSLDTLRPERYAEITRRDRLSDVLDGLRAAQAAGLDPVKVNAVPVRGVNDDEIVDLVDFALAHGYRLRFIESMPLDAQGAWDRYRMVTADEILDRLGERYELEPAGRADNAPAEEWRIVGTDSVVGVIASVTRAFCGSCDRVRLTADGQLRDCLFATEESDLRTMLRGGANDATIEGAWRTSIARKGAGHAINDPGFRQPERPMSAIGG